MVKPRNRPEIVDTAFIEGVTPLWVEPGKTPVPRRYYAASLSLADWAGPNWSDNAATGFFPLRHFLIGICERWQVHDWQADADVIAILKRDAKHRETLARTTRAFRQAIGKSAFRRAERDFGVLIAAALCPDAQIGMPYLDGCNAVADALVQFEKMALRPNHDQIRFGPLRYKVLPARLPQREVALSLVLADFITGYRLDEHRTGGIYFPRAPVMSPNLPWKAITEFATAFSDDPEAQFDHRKVATCVKKLHGKVYQIMRDP